MNKRYIFCGIFLFLAMLVFAQKAEDKIIFPGFGLGASSSDAKLMSGSDLGYELLGYPALFNNAENEFSFAFNLGVMFDYFVIDKLALTVGLYYESSPVKYTYPKRAATEDLEFTGEFTFLTIPVGMHYFFTNWFFLGGGFYAGLPISDDAEVAYGSDSISFELQTNNDLGFFLDAGFNFELTNGNSILLGMRYKHGLTKVYDEDDLITNIKMRTFLFNAAYGIKL